MTVPDLDAGIGLVSFEAFGVAMWVATNRREARDRIPEILPPGWRPIDDADVKHRLAIIGDERGTYGVDLGGEYLIEGVSLDIALDSLDTAVRMRIAFEASDRIFVHAGAIGHAGAALLLPGSSFAGKTTLVAALLRAGATYYSDEYAVLDDDGFVHPYAKPLAIRGGDGLQRNHDVEALGGTVGDRPLPVRGIVVTTYRPGTEWAPKPLDAGSAALALLAHAVPARDRPGETLQAATRAAEGAFALEGDRGEAVGLAPALLAELEARAS